MTSSSERRTRASSIPTSPERIDQACLSSIPRLHLWAIHGRDEMQTLSLDEYAEAELL